MGGDAETDPDLVTSGGSKNFSGETGLGSQLSLAVRPCTSHLTSPSLSTSSSIYRHGLTTKVCVKIQWDRETVVHDAG